MQHSNDSIQFNIEKIKLIIGLGNIGREYIGTRHNVGFELIEKIAETHRFNEEKKFKALMHKTAIDDHNLLLAKPITLMNASGESVQSICKFYKLYSNEILVIHDDLDLQLGEYKIQFAKGPKIHNGILSIENRLGTKNFWRLRVGIENRTIEKKRYMTGTSYVLGRFQVKEVYVIQAVIEDVVNRFREQIKNNGIKKAEDERPEAIDRMLKALKGET